MNEFDIKSIEFKRNLVKELLSQCTEEQQGFFNRMYKSIDDIPEEKMRWAYLQCQRTIENNKNKAKDSK